MKEFWNENGKSLLISTGGKAGFTRRWNAAVIRGIIRKRSALQRKRPVR